MLTQIVEERPDFPLAQFHLGLLHEERGRRSQARAAYAAEVAAHPGHFKARFNLGKILWELGDRRGSQEQMREVIRIAPRRPEGHLFLARGLLQESAPLDQVQPLVERGLALAEAPDLKALGWLLMADVWSRRREPGKMNQALRRAESYVSATRSEGRNATRIR
jgi:tetratricopeptide (TPR) repeat protein